MSGFEIAGMLLGAFPLIISAAEHYKEGFEPLMKWKRFRTDFLGFIDEIDIQRQDFDQILERFLISAKILDNEIELLMTKPNYEGWQSKELVKSMKTRLGASYDVFMNTVETISKLLEELKSVLSLENGEVQWVKDGSSRWDFQMKRIQLSFSKRGPKLVASVESHNRKLRVMLDSTEKLGALRSTRKDTTWASVLQTVRRHASSMHTAIKGAWTCECNRPHKARLQLEKHTAGGWNSNFKMVFEMEAKSLEEPDSLRNVRKDVVLRVQAANCYDTIAPTVHPNSRDIPETNDYIPQLRKDFESSLSNKNACNPLFASPSKAVPNSTGWRDLFRKSDVGMTINEPAAMNLTEVAMNERGLQTKQTAKIKKSARFALSEEPPRALVISTPSPETFNNMKIENLCSALRKPSSTLSYAGYLADNERKHQIQIVQSPNPSTERTRMISLESLLTGREGLRLSKYERYTIASILASSLLQLQNTPWESDGMIKKNIFFQHDDHKVFIKQPYISQTFKSTKIVTEISSSNTTLTPASSTLSITSGLSPTLSPSPILARQAIKTALHSLGIVLLELCFNMPIETSPYREPYLSPNGQPDKYTDYFTALDWADMVYEEEPRFNGVIKACVLCPFLEKPDWEDGRFCQAVWDGVVVPLEGVVGTWGL